MPLRIAHVTASPNFGGVERLILEVAGVLERTRDVKHIVASFSEGGNAKSFLDVAEKLGFTTCRLRHDMPRLVAATFELIRLLKRHDIQLLCAHGHKARMLGWFATQWLRIPIVGISHGWTGESRNVQLYERIDKWMHRRMNHVVCVSQGQADKVIRFGTPADRVSVIYNAIRLDRFDKPSDISYRHCLEAMFPKTFSTSVNLQDQERSSTDVGGEQPVEDNTGKPKWIIGAAGRLSPEKGFDVLIAAAGQLVRAGLDVGVVIFGEGVLRESLQKQIEETGIAASVSMPGFTDQLDQYMGHFDLFVQSSHTEGMPSVLLEALAARTAVVATQVGGTGELIVEGSTGLMVPPNNPNALAEAMQKVLSNDELRRTMEENGRQRVEQCFDLEDQAEQYWKLFCRLTSFHDHSSSENENTDGTNAPRQSTHGANRGSWLKRWFYSSSHFLVNLFF
jgi:glycosyltransferase involved in cell wall biosynthesis